SCFNAALRQWQKPCWIRSRRSDRRRKVQSGGAAHLERTWHTFRAAQPKHHKEEQAMRTATAAAIVLAFVSGVAISPLAQHALSDARAQPTSLAPAAIDLMALKHADLPTTP